MRQAATEAVRGRRRPRWPALLAPGVLCAGTLLFALLDGVSTGQGMLIAARVVRGVGGAVTSTALVGVIVAAFLETGEQARAAGFLSLASAAGGAIGLPVGGLVTPAVSWHWIFFVNLPTAAWASGRALTSWAPRWSPRP